MVEEHDRVEARVAELMGTINLATAALVDVIADVVERDTWGTAGGIRTAEHWVQWQCGVSPARAANLVQMARRQHEFPTTHELFAAGQLTEDTMAAVARRAPAERDHEIADLAGRLLYSQVDRLLSTLPKPPKPEAEPVPSRCDFGVTDDRWVLRANLSLDEGALVEKALTAARSEVFFERHPDATIEGRSDVTWADGLVRAADAALRGVGREKYRPAHRNQVVMHFDVTDRTARFHLGDVVPDSVRRYFTCDADIRAMFEGYGELLAITERQQTVSNRMRTFIEQRDGGCRVPGCQQKRWLHIHHLVHWEDGGPTTSCNLCALCPTHHRLHHAGLLEIRGDPSTIDGLRFYDQRGREITVNPPSPPTDPLHPPPQPYAHPSGERLNWYWFDWLPLDRANDTN